MNSPCFSKAAAAVLVALLELMVIVDYDLRHLFSGVLTPFESPDRVFGRQVVYCERMP